MSRERVRSLLLPEHAVDGKGGGMLEANEAGAFTLARDEESCMVFGMLRKAMGPGTVGYVLPLGEITETVLKDCGQRIRRK